MRRGEQAAQVGLKGLLRALREHWVGLLDLLLPLVFALWGQYVGVLLSDRAIAFARDDTRRLQADRALLEARARAATTGRQDDGSASGGE